MNKILRWPLIILSVLLVSWYYDYHELVGKSPQSFHHWRQSDCASLVQNFAEKDLPFWKPEIHGLVSDSGASGKNAPSELALYYWGIGQLYDIFGADESLFRSINTLLFLAGIAAFIWALFLISQNLLWSILLGLLLFSSPILVSYGNNFLTNAPSFGMALCALTAFTAFFKTSRKKYWWWATLFFFLAGALKLPGLFLFFALGAVVFFHPFALLRKRDYILSAILILLPLGAWIAYASHYNQSHNTVYFSTTIFAIWEYSRAELQFMISEIRKMWWGEHFHPYTFIGLGLLLLFIFLKRAKIHKTWFLLLFYLVLGLVAYSILQFYTFMSHDYYTINMFMLAALVLLIFSHYLRENRPGFLSSPWSLALLGLISIANIYYARERLEFRYTGFPNEYYAEHPLLYKGGSEWLDEIGVGKDDSIIFVKDDSHTSLYLLDRYGWTTHKMAFKDTSKTIYFNRSEEGIRRSINRGAEYLLVHDLQTLYEEPHLSPFIKHLVNRKNDLFVFDLRDTSQNFSLPERQLLDHFYFGFENTDTIEPIASRLVRDSTAVSGNYVLRAALDDEFLAGMDLPEVKTGMLIEAQVWVKSHPDAKVVPVISSAEPGLAFEQKTNILKSKKGWRHQKQQLLVSKAMEDQGIKVFLWNPEQREALFDDLEIFIYDKNPLQEDF